MYLTIILDSKIFLRVIQIRESLKQTFRFQKFLFANTESSITFKIFVRSKLQEHVQEKYELPINYISFQRVYFNEFS